MVSVHWSRRERRWLKLAEGDIGGDRLRLESLVSFIICGGSDISKCLLESARACNEAECGFDALAMIMVQQVSEVEDIGSDLVPECVTFSSIGWAVNKRKW